MDECKINLTNLQYDLTTPFYYVLKILDSLIKYIDCLPEKIDIEKHLLIAHVDFSKIAGANKLTIRLQDKLNFKRGDTILKIKLRAFTRAEPVSRNVKVGLGDIPYPILNDIVNGLESIREEKLSYQIVCSPEQFESTTTNIISVYLPAPLGEGLPDLVSSTIVTIKEQ